MRQNNHGADDVPSSNSSHNTGEDGRGHDDRSNAFRPEPLGTGARSRMIRTTCRPVSCLFQLRLRLVLVGLFAGASPTITSSLARSQYPMRLWSGSNVGVRGGKERGNRVETRRKHRASVVTRSLDGHRRGRGPRAAPRTSYVGACSFFAEKGAVEMAEPRRAALAARTIVGIHGPVNYREKSRAFIDLCSRTKPGDVVIVATPHVFGGLL